MNVRTIILAIAAVFLFAVGFAAASWRAQGQIRDAVSDARDANVRAAHFELAYNEVTGAWEELALQAGTQEELINELRQRNESLASDLEESDSRILVLEQVVSEVRAALDSSETTVVADEEVVEVQVSESVVFRGGGSLSVEGTITLRATPAPDNVEHTGTSLTATGSFPLTVTISRTADGDLRVDAFTGDPRLTVSSVDVTTNLSESRSAKSGLWSAIGRAADRQFLGVGPWINRAIGFGACLVTR